MHHQSGGNPFYALQLASSGREHSATRAPDGLGVPPAVAQAITAELAELSPGGNALANAAAVVGDPFELDLAVAASGDSEDEVLERIDELVLKGLVRVTDVPRRFQFRHPLVRSAVHGSSSPGARVVPPARRRRAREAGSTGRLDGEPRGAIGSTR